MKVASIATTVVVSMIAAVITFGLAASLPATSRTVAGGNAAVARCESDGVVVTRTLTGSNVVSVTVGSISAACGNGSISVTVDNGASSSTGTATVPGAGGSVVVTLATPIAVTESTTTHLTIVGG